MIIESRHANLYRNKKIPREPLPFDKVLKCQLQRAEKKIDKFDDKIIRHILEKEETEAEMEKPL
jgi:hypothetical protein